MLKIQDKMFLVNRKVQEHHQIDVKWWRYKTKSDKVFRAQGFYYFVEEIKDVEHINDGQLSLDFTE